MNFNSVFYPFYLGSAKKMNFYSLYNIYLENLTWQERANSYEIAWKIMIGEFKHAGSRLSYVTDLQILNTKNLFEKLNISWHMGKSWSLLSYEGT